MACDRPVLFGPKNHCRLSNGSSCGPCNKLKELRSRMKKANQKLHRELLPQINHIVSSIFELSVPHIQFDTEPYGNIDEVWEDITARLNLAAACRDWRRIALSTPQLWNSLLINLRSSEVKRDVEVIQAWLDRSGNLPLSIRIYSYDDPEESQLTEVRNMMDIINEVSSRWQALDFRNFSSFPWQLIGNPQDSEPSLLRSLRLEPGKNVISRPFNVFISMVSYKSIEIQWDRVTWVTLMDFSLDDCLELLKSVQQIRHCTVIGVGRVPSTLDPIPFNIIVHHVEDLTFDGPYFDLLHEFFSRVSFPSLKRLVINGSEEEFAAGTLTAFFKRSAYNTLYTSDDIICVLREVPSLIQLELLTTWDSSATEDNVSPEAFFKYLAHNSATMEGSLDPHESTFLPNLQTLRYDALCSFSWALLPPIFGLVSELNNPSRTPRPLKSFHLSFYPYVPRNSISLIDKQKAGLDFKINPWPNDNFLLSSCIITAYHLVRRFPTIYFFGLCPQRVLIITSKFVCNL
ncbi:hypothetical protein CPB84DRAFT_1795940 [Gymnopilus junonius]|uniref:F-box domain-containing protein n=1 Tax=Gymnopilus junonius TaxID=109634 RepID=A0A9P5NCT1_GYMJU|nr:hypothetical protein CPB84DRAFT_1795940 [Gymnopilus junonius]